MLRQGEIHSEALKIQEKQSWRRSSNSSSCQQLTMGLYDSYIFDDKVFLTRTYDVNRITILAIESQHWLELRLLVSRVPPQFFISRKHLCRESQVVVNRCVCGGVQDNGSHNHHQCCTPVVISKEEM